MASSSNLTLVQQRQRAAFWFLVPMIIMLAIVAGWPLFRSIYFSFTDSTLSDLNGGKWVGLKNYLEIRTLESGKTIYRGVLADDSWWRFEFAQTWKFWTWFRGAFFNTIFFAVVSVSLELFFGLCVALVLNKEFKGRGFVRAAILIPWAIPTIVSAKMWGWMLNDQFGIINDIFLRLGFIDQKIAWASNTDTAMMAVIAVDVWKTTPFMALLCLAGLQMVPRDVYEAAKIDGIHPVKVFWKVTLPLIRPAIMVAVIFRMLDALRIFDLVYVLTPNSDATRTMSVIAKENMFDFNKLAYGSAQSTLLFCIILVFVSLYIWLGKVDLTGEAKR